MNSSYEVKPQYSFAVEQSGDTYTFTYNRAKYSLAMYLPLSIMIFVLIMLLTSIFAKHMSNGLLPAIFIPIVICILISMQRGKGQFKVSPTDITINGKAYDRRHISRVYFELPGKYNNGVEIRSGFQAIGDGLRDKIAGQIEAKNYIVGFIYAERHIKLAGGMNATSAEVLYNKIREILKLYY